MYYSVCVKEESKPKATKEEPGAWLAGKVAYQVTETSYHMEGSVLFLVKTQALAAGPVDTGKWMYKACLVTMQWPIPD